MDYIPWELVAFQTMVAFANIFHLPAQLPDRTPKSARRITGRRRLFITAQLLVG